MPAAMEPRHPTASRPLNDLERAIWRLRLVAHEAQIMLRGFNRSPDAAKALNNELLFGLSHQALILVTKFLEIWGAFGSLHGDDPRVIPTRRAITPVLDRIRVWKGLDEFRNSALAHAYLAKDGTVLPPWELQATGRAPSYHAEILLLLNLVNLAVLATLSVFAEEYRPLDVLIRGPRPAPDKGPGIQFGTEIDAELHRVAGPLEGALQAELGVRPDQALVAAFGRAVRP